jgi:hypothetical protein
MENEVVRRVSVSSIARLDGFVLFVCDFNACERFLGLECTRRTARDGDTQVMSGMPTENDDRSARSNENISGLIWKRLAGWKDRDLGSLLSRGATISPKCGRLLLAIGGKDFGNLRVRARVGNATRNRE